MEGLKSTWRCLSAHFGASDQEVDDELRFHIEMRIVDNIALGMTPDEARIDALRRFGDIDGVRQECYAIAREHYAKISRWLLRILVVVGLVLWAGNLAPALNVLGQMTVIVAILCVLLLHLRLVGQDADPTSNFRGGSRNISSVREWFSPLVYNEKNEPARRRLEFSVVVILLILSILTASIAVAAFSLRFSANSTPAHSKRTEK